jgi:hypothetical protein
MSGRISREWFEQTARAAGIELMPWQLDTAMVMLNGKCGEEMTGLFNVPLRCVLEDGHAQAHRTHQGEQFGRLDAESVPGLHGCEQTYSAVGGES